MKNHPGSRLLPLAVAVLAILLALPAFAMDHSKLIVGPINSGSDATKQCLKCHDDEATAIMQTPHWTWTRQQVVNGKQIDLGKINAFNNFCTSTSTNRVHCSECHIGYGWRDQSFDFADKTKVDCLVCHDTTGTYHKDGNNAGEVEEGVDILRVAQHVGKPSRYNCGACHFYGGGGDAVKHGDLDSTMEYPDKDVDIHMSPDGQDFACQTCHETESHMVSGADMATSPDGKNAFGCTRCHDAAPHKQSRLNQHTATVACQTCHIPAFARGERTQMDWDWSTAGKEVQLSSKADVTYRKTMGTLTWKKNVVPTYAWFNGKSGVYLRGEKMDPSKPTKLTYPLGDIKDPQAKIYPFKVHTGKADLRFKERHPDYRPRLRQGWLLEHLRLGQCGQDRHGIDRSSLQRPLWFCADGNVLAHRPPGRSQGQGPAVPRLPWRQRPARLEGSRLRRRPHGQSPVRQEKINGSSFHTGE